MNGLTLAKKSWDKDYVAAEGRVRTKREPMDLNITEQQYSDDNLQLTEPHFDEEATVLSARPVVPLEEIKEAPSRKHLAFGLSIVASLIVGGLAATFILKQRWQKPATEITGAAIAGSGANATDSAASAPSGGEVKENLTANPEVSAASEDKDSQVKVTSPIKRSQTRTVQPILPNPEDEKAALEEISRAERREMRRAARLEEWRLRRQEARGAGDFGRRRRRSSDDLLRIREIFEGSRRP